MPRPEGNWQTALRALPDVQGRWVLGGSVSLALQGVPVEPNDIDVIADGTAASGFVTALATSVVSDDSPYERGVVRAHRRVAAVVAGMKLEVLVNVEAHGDGGQTVPSPDLEALDVVDFEGRLFRVVPIEATLRVLDVMGRHARADLVRAWLAARSPHD